jgi:hypothetical protein
MKIARWFSNDCSEFKLQLVFRKSTLKRELQTGTWQNKLKDVSAINLADDACAAAAHDFFDFLAGDHGGVAGSR